MEKKMMYEISFDGKENIEIAKKLLDGCCTILAYNSYGTVLGQLEIVVPVGEIGYTITPNKKEGLAILGYIPEDRLDEAIDWLYNQGIRDMIYVTADSCCNNESKFDDVFVMLSDYKEENGTVFADLDVGEKFTINNVNGILMRTAPSFYDESWEDGTVGADFNAISLVDGKRYEIEWYVPVNRFCGMKDNLKAFATALMVNGFDREENNMICDMAAKILYGLDKVTRYKVWFSYKTDPEGKKHYLRDTFCEAQAKQLVELYSARDYFDADMELAE